MRDHGPLGRFAYWKPFEAHAVECALADFPDAIIDLGAGHSDYDDQQLFARVQAALAPMPHEILLKPSSSLEESLTILGERVNPEEQEELERPNRSFLTNSCNKRFATHTVLTGRRSLGDECEEVLALIS